MARKYRRDSIGRFSGGGGGGSKAASTRAANTARAAGLKAKGTTGLGARVKAKGFAGGKGAQQRAGGLRKNQIVAAKSGGFRGNVIAKGGNGVRGSVARSIAASKRARTAKAASAAAPGPARKKRPVLDAIARPIVRALSRR